VDTFCINKADFTELSAAINSMFRWYQKAPKCYVYLTDVHLKIPTAVYGQGQPDGEKLLQESRWSIGEERNLRATVQPYLGTDCPSYHRRSRCVTQSWRIIEGLTTPEESSGFILCDFAHLCGSMIASIQCERAATKAAKVAPTNSKGYR
ncbi:hypothetical protein BX600DRAFT_385669, partial [Xylariales sp. PMI_506]